MVLGLSPHIFLISTTHNLYFQKCLSKSSTSYRFTHYWHHGSSSHFDHRLFCLFPLWPCCTSLSPEHNTCYHPLQQSIQYILSAFTIKPQRCWTYNILQGPAPAYFCEPHLLSHSSFPHAQQPPGKGCRWPPWPAECTSCITPNHSVTSPFHFLVALVTCHGPSFILLLSVFPY